MDDVPPPAATPQGTGTRPDLRGLRVVLVAPCAPPVSGMQVQADLLAERLRSEGATAVRVATNPRVPSVIVPVGPVADVWRRSRFRTELVKAIGGGADVLHVHGACWSYFRTVVAPALAEGRDAGMRTVLRWDGGDADRFLAERGDEVRTALCDADEVVVPTGHLAEVLSRRLGRTCRVIANLIPDPDPECPPAPRAGPLRLLCARHLSRPYGVDVVVRAAAAAAAEGADLRLTIVGDGRERRAIEALAAQSLGSRVQVIGAVSHARFHALLRESDVLVNGSWVDNAPVSLAEALGAGVPVATTEAGGIPWIVRHGRTGLVTPVGDVQALAGSIVSLARDRVLLEDLGWRAKVEALAWTWEAVKPAWADAFRTRRRTRFVAA